MTSPTPNHPQAPARPARPYAALFGLLALACCLDSALLGPYAVVRFHDIFDVEFLHYLTQGRLFLEHGLFSWYPEYCGGLPSFAAHHAPWYPMSLAAPFLPLWLIYLLFRLGLGLAAGLGAFRFLRELLGVDRDIALTLGAAFALTALLLIPHFVFAFAFPLVFMILADFGDPGLPWRGRIARLAGLAGLCLVSYPVLALPHYPLLHLGLFAAYQWKSPRRARHFWTMILFWLAYGLMQLPIVAALFQYIPFTQRLYDATPPDFWPALKIMAARFAKIMIQDEPLFPLAVCGLAFIGRSARVRPLLVLSVLAGLMHAFFVSPFKALLAATILSKMDLGNITQVLPLLYALAGGAALHEARREAQRGSGNGRSNPSLLWAGLGLAAMAPFLSAHHLITALGLTLAGLAVAARCPADSNQPEPRGIHTTSGAEGSDASHGPGMAGTGAGPLGRLQASLAARLGPGLARRAPALSAFGLALAGMLILQQNLVGHSHVPYARGFTPRPALEALAREAATAPFRVACLDLHPTVAQASGLEVVEQKSVLFNKYFKRLIKEAVRPQFADPKAEARFDKEWYHLFLGLPDVHENLFLTFHPGKPRRASDLNLGLLGLLNVRYLLSSKPVEGMAAYGELVATDPGAAPPALLAGNEAARRFYGLPIWIYRLKDGVDRVRLASRAKVLGDEADLPRAMAGERGAELGRTVFFAAGDIPGNRPAHRPGDKAGSPAPGQTGSQTGGQPADQSGGQTGDRAGNQARGAGGFVPAEQDLSDAAAPPVTITEYGPDRIAARGEAPAGGYLVLAENFDPKWSARLNGAPATLVRADGAFMALKVPAGPFTAEFAFADPLVRWLHVPALAGLALLLALPWITRSRTAEPAPFGPKGPSDPARDASDTEKGAPVEGGDSAARPAAAASPAPSTRDRAEAKAEAAPWRPVLAAGLTASLLWAGLFFLFVMRRHADTPVPTGYGLLTIPFIGLAIAVWVGWMWRMKDE
jgi:hypothetical protein